MSIRYDGRVAIITGAGNGLGRSHALGLASRGAKVLVNDLGGAVDGTGESDAAREVVEEIIAAGGEAMANGADVSKIDEVKEMVAQVITEWGGVDILVNNAGILRDKTFSKMTMNDFRHVVDVHLMGSVYCTKAVWNDMKEKGFGRIVMTTSSSGLYGNFGQANYGAAKMAVVGLMNTLVMEGEKYNIKVNCLAPAAGTRMLEGLMSEENSELMTPKAVTAGLLTLCDDEAPNRTILCAGGGGFACTHIYETNGVFLPDDAQDPENVRARMEAINDPKGEELFVGGYQQADKFLEMAQRNNTRTD
ncbi:MAG: 3-oxoacyl-ACP reductase [Cellvibrionales bacterium TMED49]|nr:3-oxoacyl-ACP reductase [Porticoccaceae bacterium]OUU35559.1 MAG: 3-oxoacyl-ACP reductase [Cellvibrionales bacterium TMED49]